MFFESGLLAAGGEGVEEVAEPPLFDHAEFARQEGLRGRHVLGGLEKGQVGINGFSSDGIGIEVLEESAAVGIEEPGDGERFTGRKVRNNQTRKTVSRQGSKR